MEVFFDFGLFELVGVMSMLLLSRWLFRYRLIALAFLAASVGLPAFLVAAPRFATAAVMGGVAAMSAINAAALAEPTPARSRSFSASARRPI